MRTVPARRALRVLHFVLLLWPTSGCAVTTRVGRPPEIGSGAIEVSERAAARCVHGASGRDSLYRIDLPGPATDPDQRTALARFPTAVLRTAVAAGIEPLLARVVIERSLHPGEQTSELLAMRDELSARMYTLETQLTAMEFEVDCVRALMNARLSDYEEQETDRQLALTIASLVVSAAAAIGAGVWELANSDTLDPALPEGPLLVGIAGAMGTAAFGAAVLVPVPQPIVYLHERNVLAPVRSGTDDQLVFPTFVFRLLTLPTAEGGPTPRQEMMAAWDDVLDDDVHPEHRALAEQIVFGPGGIYDPGLLRVHQALLEELGATLDGLARDIDLLASTITIVLTTDPTSEP